MVKMQNIRPWYWCHGNKDGNFSVFYGYLVNEWKFVFFEMDNQVMPTMKIHHPYEPHPSPNSNVFLPNIIKSVKKEVSNIKIKICHKNQFPVI